MFTHLFCFWQPHHTHVCFEPSLCNVNPKITVHQLNCLVRACPPPKSEVNRRDDPDEIHNIFVLVVCFVHYPSLYLATSS
jgi:hypothetical protein